MKIIFILLFSLSCFVLYSQNRKTDSYIQKLDNSQFIINHQEKASFKMDSPAAMKLIKTGKPATGKLIAALSDTTKTIMAHLILCHIYFKHASFAGPKVMVTDNGDLYKYFLGEEKGQGLVLSETNTNNVFRLFVTGDDRKEIIAYWKNKAVLPKKS